MKPKSSTFYYRTAAARDFGLTIGTRDTPLISLTDLGQKAVYPGSPEEEQSALRQAFGSIEIFRRVLEHFGGSTLPEERFLSNTLETTFSLPPSLHREFIELFTENCRYLGIGTDYSPKEGENQRPSAPSSETVTLGAVESGAATCFVIMPFRERDEDRQIGFFDELMTAVFTPAITAAGFVAKTAKRQGTDVIQSTIVTELLEADLVLADLTEHNPNVLFELGMRMAEDKPVALVRARGTGPIFDVDNMLRVEEYNPNLWPSTVEKDIPRLTAHILATWENRGTDRTFMRILRQRKESLT